MGSSVLIGTGFGMGGAGQAPEFPVKPASKSVPELMASMKIRPIRDKVLAPDFSLKTLESSEISLSSKKGSVVMLSFWATW